VGILDRVGRFIDDVLLLPEELRVLVERGREALDGGDPAEAARLYTQVLAERPGLIEATVGLANAREALGDPAGARAALAAGRELDPDDPRLALPAARLALAAGDAADAVEAARVAAGRLAGGGDRAEGALLEAFLIWGRGELLRGRPDRAARELRKATTLAPRDAGVRAELVDALARARAPVAAEVAARALDPARVAPGLAGRIGAALHGLGRGEAAGPWLARAAEAGDLDALETLAVLDADAGDLAGAEDRVRAAVASGHAGPRGLGLLATILGASGRGTAAAEAFAAAGRPLDALRVTPWDDGPALAGAAAAASAGDAGAPHPLVRAVRARPAGAEVSSPDAGDGDGAAADPRDEPRLLLARAERLLARAGPADRDAAEEALGAIDRWREAVTPPHPTGSAVSWAREVGVARALAAVLDRPQADRLRARALRRRWRTPDGAIDLPAAIDAVARMADAAELGELARAARALRDDLDRPLLLAVLGEFNAGKSTFVNAFVGAEVAPTGVLPTTGTLNLLRAGAERRVRAVHRDGSTRETDWAGLKGLLDAAGAPGAETIPVDRVEILLPSERLEATWILDSPGTNALDPAHEALAREAIRRADAALWLFDAAQAGKATEAALLRELAESQRWFLPVLNKVDRLPDPADVDRVLRVLGEALPAGSPPPVVLSARRALRGRLAGDQGEVAASGWSALVDRLSTEVFARSRALKAGATAGRLRSLLDGALEVARADDDSARAGVEGLAAGLAAWPGVAERLRGLVDGAVRMLDAEEDDALRQAVDELRAFARPRRTRWAGRGVDPEDRAFLVETIHGRLTQGVHRAGERLVEDIRGQVREAAPWLPGERVDEWVAEAVLPMLHGWLGYRRGLLEGGRLEAFLSDALRSPRLDDEALAGALPRLRADVRGGLGPGLGDATDALVGRLQERHRRMLAEAVEARRDRRRRALEPLEALREVLEGSEKAPER